MQRACALAGPLAVVLYLAAFGVLAGFIPPTPPRDSAQEVARFYADNRDAIRLGMVISIPAAMVLLPFYLGIAASIARIERRRFPVLALMQLAGGVILLVFFLVCSLVWITASFRGETDPGTIRMLHDFGWLVFVMAWPEYTVQMGAISAAILKDHEQRGPWPRWFGWFTAWVAFSGAGGSLAVFFKHGAFAWNGLIGFYLPFAIFLIWILLHTYLSFADARRRSASADDADELPFATTEPPLAEMTR